GKLKYCGPVKEIGQFISEKTGIRTGSGITFVLRGKPQAILQALPEIETKALTSRADGLTTFYSEQVNPEFINQCIDRLRTHQIQILEILHNNVSLEDAFLTLLSQPADDEGKTNL
ncbi:MAG: hypothetical protein VX438_18205, partial [Planctomycetota bacterium]|nr:hypothetical protein [Planctomycetota bacterium]